jgi:chaperonin GroEL (HSP60 family)
MHASTKLSDQGAEGVLRRALEYPFERILKNAGYEMAGTENVGWVGEHFYVLDLNAEVKQSEWWASGVFDPIKVTTASVTNAISVAQLIMTLAGVITDEVAGSPAAAQSKVFQKAFESAMEGAL